MQAVRRCEIFSQRRTAFLQICEKFVKNQPLKYLQPFSKFCYFAIEFKTKIL